jgi:integrase
MSIIQLRGKFAGQEIVDAQRKHLEPDEVKRFFSVLKPDPFWFGYFRLQYYFGCRISEIALILKEDVSFGDNGIIIRRLKKRRFPVIAYLDDNGKRRTRLDKEAEPGAGFIENVYSLNPHLRGVIEDVMQVSPPKNPWLFGSDNAKKLRASDDRLVQLRRVKDENGKQYRAVSRDTAHTKFVKAAHAAQIPSRLQHSHVLRHTRATLMLAAGAPPQDVKELLGHASIDVTYGYLHVAKSLKLRMDTSAELGLGDVDES